MILGPVSIYFREKYVFRLSNSQKVDIWFFIFLPSTDPLGFKTRHVSSKTRHKVVFGRCISGFFISVYHVIIFFIRSSRHFVEQLPCNSRATRRDALPPHASVAPFRRRRREPVVSHPDVAPAPWPRCPGSSSSSQGPLRKRGDLKFKAARTRHSRKMARRLRAQAVARCDCGWMRSSARGHAACWRWVARRL